MARSVWNALWNELSWLSWIEFWTGQLEFWTAPVWTLNLIVCTRNQGLAPIEKWLEKTSKIPGTACSNSSKFIAPLWTGLGLNFGNLVQFVNLAILVQSAHHSLRQRDQHQGCCWLHYSMPTFNKPVLLCSGRAYRIVHEAEGWCRGILTTMFQSTLTVSHSHSQKKRKEKQAPMSSSTSSSSSANNRGGKKNGA